MPPFEIQYLGLVARAAPGLYTAEYIEWELPPERGWALIHLDDVVRGERMKWPVEEHNEGWREWLSFKHWCNKLSKKKKK